ncbi:MAG: indolepyruvate oxidoreductase subunit beta [Phycisphaerales bacterium]|nr:MAG: indolepyruvate oxidoreductase subunit beta [Phycisphaerales bacterium]
MEFNIILAGVGGQGILTIAHAISRAAMRRGYHVRQSEVHGMSQRGGAVQSHLRFSEQEIFSDLIPYGQAHFLLVTEPLEAMRYVEFLDKRGVIVANTIPVVNIPNYPPIEQVLDDVARFGDHILIDAKKLAGAAGSARAENMVMLGAASSMMGFEPAEFEAVIAEAFAAKGERIVETNQRAFRYGRSAAVAFRDGLARGLGSREVRRRLSAVSADRLHEPPSWDPPAAAEAARCELSDAEADAIAQTIHRVTEQQRSHLYEHEVYGIVELVGAICPPRHLLVPRGGHVNADELAPFPGDKVVLKIVSPDVTHKSDSGGIAFTPRNVDAVNREIDRLIALHAAHTDRVEGVLLVEYVKQANRSFGSELFVGIRATREFGPVIAAGLGGIDTEFLAVKMQRGLAMAKASAVDVSAEEFFELFRRTAAYEILSGGARGHERVVADGDLINCFRAFIAIARRFCTHGLDAEGILELEVNPFAFVHQRLLPLDGLGRIGALARPAPARPIEKVKAMLEPRSIAVVGVSSKRANFGRIILNNIQDCGFPAEHLYVIKSDETEVDGVRCVPTLADLPEPVDLLVAAAGADRIPTLVDDVLGGHADGVTRCASVILIPGGLGEKDGTQSLEQQVRAAITSARARPDRGAVFLGGNCMGVRCRPGRYDTFFIPETKLDPRRDVPPKRSALISQSGAFIITRLSNLEFLDPAIAISAGNQIDVTLSDLLEAVGERDDLDCIGVYAEGFNDLDGLAFIRAVNRVAESGKVVVFYKAGRTSAGRTAAQGHTASLAGDYDVCQAAVEEAGAIVTDTFKEFEQLLELSTDLHGKTVRGRRIGAISNAGYETVGMADNVKGSRYDLDVAALTPETRERLSAALERHNLGTLANARNPLDLTPMADDQAYEDCIRVMMEADEIDAVVVGCVPLTPRLLTTPAEIARPGSLAERLPKIFHEYDKPLVFVVDSTERYDAFARAVRIQGVPVFRTADQAIRSVGRYLCHARKPRPLSSAANVRDVATVPS